jgi:hypothetical protein
MEAGKLVLAPAAAAVPWTAPGLGPSPSALQGQEPTAGGCGVACPNSWNKLADSLVSFSRPPNVCYKVFLQFPNIPLCLLGLMFFDIKVHNKTCSVSTQQIFIISQFISSIIYIMCWFGPEKIVYLFNFNSTYVRTAALFFQLHFSFSFLSDHSCHIFFELLKIFLKIC